MHHPLRSARRHFIALAAMAALGGAAAPARATYYWAYNVAACDGGTYNWTANCWTTTVGSTALAGSYPPYTGNNGVVLYNPYSAAIAINWAATANVAYNFLAIDNLGNGSLGVSQTQGGVSFATRSTIGQTGGGSYGITTGQVTFSDLTIGASAGALGGALRLSSTGYALSTSITAGDAGEGSIVQTGNSSVATTGSTGLTLGHQATGVGRYDISGGNGSFRTIAVGDAGQGLVTQTGGTVSVTTDLLIGATATSTIGSRYDLNGGTLSVQGKLTTPNGRGVLGINGGNLVVAGDIQLNALDIGSVGNLNLAAGQTLSTTGSSRVDGRLSVGGSLTFAGGASVGSTGQLVLAGGTLDGSGTVLTHGLLSGSGRVTGNLGVTVLGNALLDSGTLVLENGDRNANFGVWTLAPGGALQLNAGSVLRNAGVLDLGGSSVLGSSSGGGSGTLINSPQGLVQGAGSVAVTVLNQGSLVLGSGPLKLLGGLSNTGDLQLGSATAAVSGAPIGNAGLIVGQGRINNAISNSGGRVQANGGQLLLAGVLDNNGGVLAADAGATLRLTAGPARNDGRIELSGGTLDTAGAGLTNAGTLAGHGSWRTGGIVNLGQVQFSGGLSEVHSGVRGEAGSQLIVSGLSGVVFDGTVDMAGGAELRVSAGSSATFFGNVVQRSGAVFSGSGQKFYEAGYSIGSAPAGVADAGSVRFGDAAVVTAQLGGAAVDGHDLLQVLGQLQFGGTLRLVSTGSFAAQAGARYDLFDWGTSSGRFQQVDTSAALLAPGLVWDTSRLYQDGTLGVSAVPEAGRGSLLAMGLGALLLAARRRSVRS